MNGLFGVEKCGKVVEATGTSVLRMIINAIPVKRTPNVACS